MSKSVAQISTKGQIVIPVELREEMGLEPGTEVVVEREGNAIVLHPVTKAFIHGLRGSTKGAGGVRNREHRRDR